MTEVKQILLLSPLFCTEGQRLREVTWLVLEHTGIRGKEDLNPGHLTPDPVFFSHSFTAPPPWGSAMAQIHPTTTNNSASEVLTRHLEKRVMSLLRLKNHKIAILCRKFFVKNFIMLKNLRNIKDTPCITNLNTFIKLSLKKSKKHKLYLNKWAFKKSKH